MSEGETAKQLQAQIELFMNEQAADLEVFQVALGTLILRLCANSRGSRELFEDLRSSALRTLEAAPVLPGQDPGASEKRRQLTIMRAEAFFQRVGEPLGLNETLGGQESSS